MGQFHRDKTGPRYGQRGKLKPIRHAAPSNGSVAKALSWFIINAGYLKKHLPN